ncbi:MAG: hypothetical protein PHC70_04830 [Patescibacteria group bacterium]|nr:hypothetical protein [Patescibacteria group bacterium]
MSLLPQNFRDKEEELKKQQAAEQAPAEQSSMHVPKDEGEDVEIIEVEEGEVDQVLKNEPLLSRAIYQAGALFEKMRDKLFAPRKLEPPPKSPPQFFQPAKKPAASVQLKPTIPSAAKPEEKVSLPTAAPAQVLAKPTPGSVSAPAPSAQTPAQVKAPGAKARIIPSSTSPRRVRIIKRVRKPVHVSLLDENEMRQMQVNVPKRKLTLVFLTLFFAAVFVASFFLLDQQQAKANESNQAATQELQALQTQIKDLQGKWSSFQDLEPRLMALSGLLDKHVSVLNVLKLLEQRTLSTVSYGGFMMDNSGQIQLSVTAPSYAVAAKQLQIFQESPEIKSVEANAFSYAEGNTDRPASVNYQLTLRLQTEALLFEKPLSAR